MDTTDRNRRMSLLVIKGYPCHAVAKIYGITTNRVRQIVLKTCYKVLGIECGYVYRDDTGRLRRCPEYPVGLVELRDKFKYRLIGEFNSGIMDSGTVFSRPA